MVKGFFSGCFGFLLLLCSTSNTWSGDFDIGVMEFERGNYAIALREWKSLASVGHMEAQYNLAWMYSNGKGVAQDYETAVKWYALAAEQGLAVAQYNLALKYDSGIGVPQNYKAAIKWYTLAAEQGHVDAQFNLGQFYDTGEGGEHDNEAALKWYTLAAEQSDSDAQYFLARLHYFGFGTLRDHGTAVKWLTLAANKGHFGAHKKLHELLRVKATLAIEERLDSTSSAKSRTNEYGEEAWVEDEWVVDYITDGEIHASVNGQITHGDRLRIRFVEGNCNVGNIITSVYTYNDHPNIAQIEDKYVNAKFMGADIVVKVLFSNPFLMGHSVFMDLGWIDKNSLKLSLSGNNAIALVFVDSEDIKITKYFDLPSNKWSSQGLYNAVDKASAMCDTLALAKWR